MIQGRDYQLEARSSIWSYFQKFYGNPVVAMPTGTGKSVVIALFLESVYRAYPNQRVMILTHVKELIQQNYEKLISLWPFAPAGIYSAGLKKRDLYAPITFAGIGSVAKKWAAFGHIDLVIIDEAHLVSPSEDTMYRTFLAGLKSINPHLKVIGLTATPWRLGHGKITDPVKDADGNEVPGIFTDICFDITGIEAFNRLIAEGYLCPVVPKSTTSKLNIDGVHMRGGEFIASELQSAVNKTDITIKAIREAMEWGYDRKRWLVFAAGVEHAIDTADIMNDLGIPTIAIHSKMSDKERDDAILKFKAGHYRAAVNNNVLTTGFDLPLIDLIICLRPTASTVLWVQMLGRGTRPVYAPGFDLSNPAQRLQAIKQGGKENCLVLDFANNSKRLGPINDPVIPRKKGQGGGDAPVKECPVCDSWVHASLRHCDGLLKDGSRCTHEFKFETKLQNEASTQELIKGDLPIVEVFKVDHITYDKSRKEGVPPSMKVAYYCGHRAFYEIVCFEHTNYAGRKAREWWRLRTNYPFPQSTMQGIELAPNVAAPTHLRVWVNKKYPEVMAVCFDGTAFGTQEAVVYTPSRESLTLPKKQPMESVTYTDDIPF